MLFNKLQLSLACSVSILTWLTIDWHHLQVTGNPTIDLFLLFQEHTSCEPQMMSNVTRQNSVAGVRFPVFGNLPRAKVTVDRR